MGVQVYVNFNRNCREAVEYYSEIFKTEKPEIMTFEEMPTDPKFILSEEDKNLVLHTSLNICGSTVMFSDVFPGMPFFKGNNISLTIISSDMDQLKDFFNKLKVEGKVDMELQETFWSKCYGSLTDKFGVIWQFNYESE